MFSQEAPLTRPHSSRLRLHAVSMVRNDADILPAFLLQCQALFEQTSIIDVQSTDGTRARLDAFDAGRGLIEILTTIRRERFQSPMVNLLCRRAFARGADWVFLLDADEFIDIGSRAELENCLHGFNAAVMQLSWINLVPARYAGFTDFDPSQDFRGCPSSYSKVALSQQFAALNPDYIIHEGSHYVSPKPGAPTVAPCPGLKLLHVPIRSASRLKYKVETTWAVTKLKHNRFDGECGHLEALDRMLGGNLSDAALNFMAAQYGEAITQVQERAWDDLGAPVKRLPPYVADGVEAGATLPPAIGLAQTLLGEDGLAWDKAPFVPGTPVAAVAGDSVVRVLPQPVYGNGDFCPPKFERLGDKAADTRAPKTMLADAVVASCLRSQRNAFSTWTGHIPLMFALVSALRPRRFVELGVHNGMSFFAACQAAEHLGLGTQCIAIDSWLGDEQAGFYDQTVLADVMAHFARHHPSQIYIRSYFDTAARCFDDGSLDLLHVDGLHTYQAVRSDIETWLPKLSDTGVILLHDTCVLERNFGVWRLWEELSRRFPSYNFLHEHGLGVVYVGTKPSPIADLLRMLAADHECRVLAQSYFAALGSRVVERTAPAQEDQALRQALQLQSERARLAEEQLHDVLTSSSWRMTGGLRSLVQRSAHVRRVSRGLAATFLPRR